MKLTLDIPNNQVDFFLQLIRSLNFDITIDKKETDIEIPEWHTAILEERLSLYETNTSGFVKWEDLKKDIEKHQPFCNFASIAATKNLETPIMK